MKFLDLFFAARPLLHLPIWSIYLVSLEYHHRLSGESFALSDLGLMLLLSMMAAGGYYLNQVYDVDSDAINRKLGFIKDNLVSAHSMRVLFLLCSVIGTVLAYLYSLVTLAIFLQLFVLSYFYSAPPFRLKDRPIAGLLANAYSFGFLVSVAVMPELNVHNSGLLGWDNPFFFLAAVAAVHLLTTIPDRNGDRIVGKRTVVVLIGPRRTKLLAIVCLALASIVAYRSEHAILFYISVVSAFPVLAAMMVGNTRFATMAAKLPILILTILAGYFFWGYLLFIVALIILTRIYYFKRFGIIYPQLA